jgi:hypothetical protein
MSANSQMNPNRTARIAGLLYVLIIPLGLLGIMYVPNVLKVAGDSLSVLTEDRIQSMVPVFFQLHEYGILIASIFWGLWLLPMGYLVYRSGFISKIPGVLLIIAGAGYLVDVLARMLSPTYGDTLIASIILVTLFGEIVFPIWLLIKGVHSDKWKEKALETV